MANYHAEVSDAELQPQKEDDRWLFALLGSDLGVWDWNAVTDEVFFSDLWCSMLGYEPQEIGDRIEEWSSLVHPEDLEPTMALVREHMEGRTPLYVSEHRMRAKDGSYRWILDRGKVVARDAKGKPLRLVGTHTDITEHKRAEHKLRESQKSFREMADNIGEIFYNYDVVGQRLLYANQAYERIWGRPVESVYANPISYIDAIHPDDLNYAKEAYQLQLQGQQPNVEFRIRRPNGEIRWVLEHGVPIMDQQGNVERIVGTIRDITEKKLADEKMCESEERFRLLCNVTNDAIWNWDLTSDTIWWNDSFGALFGYTHEEMGDSIHAWYERIHPEERDAVIAKIHQAIQSGAPHWSDEYRFLRRDGIYAHVLDRGYVIHDSKGKAVRMIGGITDQTERKHTEERLREQATLLDKAQDAILVRDLNHNVLYWNSSAARLYGWSAEEAIGTCIKDLIYADLGAFDKAVQILMQDGEWTGELPQVTKNGQPLTIESRWTLVRNDKGRPKSILSINTDITERKRLELQFLRAQRMESIGTLAGGIAHDLNNVLAPIMMSIDLLKMREKDPQRLNILTTIEASAQRGADMVRQVLTFARGMEGQQVEVHIGSLFREIEKIANETFLKSIRVRCDYPNDLWSIQGDPTQLHQVLINLCVNARDAMPYGGTLNLRASNLMLDKHYANLNPEAHAGPYLFIQVEDTGTGMKPQVLERIFEPFFTTKELGKGTGLGLSTTLAIIKGHGGFVRVQSESGGGTRFHIYLPAQIATAEEEQPPPEAPSLPRGNGELVLLVDDEAPVRQITRQTLEAFGYRVLMASDGAVATALFAEQKENIAVVLTDMMMPIMDGPAMIPVLMRMDPKVRIITASGVNAKAMVAKANQAGVKYFIPKPYSAETLLKTLHQILHEQP